MNFKNYYIFTCIFENNMLLFCLLLYFRYGFEYELVIAILCFIILISYIIYKRNKIVEMKSENNLHLKFTSEVMIPMLIINLILIFMNIFLFALYVELNIDNLNSYIYNYNYDFFQFFIAFSIVEYIFKYYQIYEMPSDFARYFPMVIFILYSGFLLIYFENFANFILYTTINFIMIKLCYEFQKSIEKIKSILGIYTVMTFWFHIICFIVLFNSALLMPNEHIIRYKFWQQGSLFDRDEVAIN